MRRCKLVILGILVAALAGGCAHYPPNPRLTAYRPDSGYRYNNLAAEGNSESLFVILTFSGGGTRAAALSYGVLEKLRDTAIVWEGRRRSLLQEVDVISSVSGGSFTAAYYGLNRERIFEDYLQRFLYRNIEGNLKRLLVNPANWLKLASPDYGRIELATELYDREIFKGKTYADLSRAGRPFIMVNATDISIGSRFTFIQEQFDLLCSDLTGVRVAQAAAASSDFPLAFTPMTLNNYSGACGFQQPRWFAGAAKDLQLNPARFRRYQNAKSYLNAEERPYIHLLDGGVADNIGLRGPLVALTSNDSPWSLPNRINRGKVKKLVVIIVDAKSVPDVTFDKTSRPPGLVSVLSTISTVPLDNYSFDTVQWLRDTVKKWQRDRRGYADCKSVLGQACPGAAMPTPPPPEVDLYPIYVGFDQIADPERRDYFQTMPTTFYLPKKEVDDLRGIGGELLDRSRTFRRLVQGLQ